MDKALAYEASDSGFDPQYGLFFFHPSSSTGCCWHTDRRPTRILAPSGPRIAPAVCERGHGVGAVSVVLRHRRRDHHWLILMLKSRTRSDVLGASSGIEPWHDRGSAPGSDIICCIGRPISAGMTERHLASLSAECLEIACNGKACEGGDTFHSFVFCCLPLCSVSLTEQRV
jgi:hypothetical protein